MVKSWGAITEQISKLHNDRYSDLSAAFIAFLISVLGLVLMHTSSVTAKACLVPLVVILLSAIFGIILTFRASRKYSQIVEIVKSNPIDELTTLTIGRRSYVVAERAGFVNSVSDGSFFSGEHDVLVYYKRWGTEPVRSSVPPFPERVDQSCWFLPRRGVWVKISYVARHIQSFDDPLFYLNFYRAQGAAETWLESCIREAAKDLDWGDRNDDGFDKVAFWKANTLAFQLQMLKTGKMPDRKVLGYRMAMLGLSDVTLFQPC